MVVVKNATDDAFKIKLCDDPDDNNSTLYLVPGSASVRVEDCSEGCASLTIYLESSLDKIWRGIIPVSTDSPIVVLAGKDSYIVTISGQVIPQSDIGCPVTPPKPFWYNKISSITWIVIAIIVMAVILVSYSSNGMW